MRRFAFSGLLLVACNAVFGVDEREPHAGGAGAGAGITSGGGMNLICPDKICERHLPSDWSGPTLVATSPDGPPTCDSGSGSPNAELTLLADPQGVAPACSCDCDPAMGIDCDSSPITVTSYTNNSCTNQHRTGSGVLGQCIDLCCGGVWGHYQPPLADVSNASCQPIEVVDIPAATWADNLVGCGPVPRERCGQEDCFEPADGTLCIYRPGDHPCPEGLFTDRTLWHSGLDDTRACEPCTCSAVMAVCNEVVEGYAVPNCDNVLEDFMMTAPTCDQAPGDWDGAKILSVSPTGTCTPSGGTPSGQVAATQPTTVCCTG